MKFKTREVENKHDGDVREKEGYADYNLGPHLLVDVPDGCSTISCKTSEGQLITFAFVPTHGKVPGCIDIEVHNPLHGKQVKNVNGEMRPVQEMIVFGDGCSHLYRYRISEKPKGNPPLFCTILLDGHKK